MQICVLECGVCVFIYIRIWCNLIKIISTKRLRPRQIGSGQTGDDKSEAGQRLIEFSQENTLIIANTLFQQHKRRLYTRTSPDGQHPQGREGSWPLWWVLEAPEQGEQSIHLWLRGLGRWGVRAEGGGFRSARMNSGDPKTGLSRSPPLWSVIAGQAGGEDRASPRPRTRGQVTPHVGPLSTFCPGLGLVLSFPAGPQRGGTRPCQEKSEHYTWAPMGLPTWDLEGPHRVHPSYQHRRLKSVPQSTLEVLPPFLSQELQEPGGEGWGLWPMSTGQRKEEVQAVPGVKVRRVPWMCTRGSPSQHRGEPTRP